ncbi:MAG: hypothetical protein Q7S06_02305 [Nanoarchaeota archaeon]|nr:hypothetical protein [Nanoarchaeota archaeon]
MDEKMIMAVIAGANEALKYKGENFNADDQEVLKFVTKKAKEIVRKID